MPMLMPVRSRLVATPFCPFFFVLTERGRLTHTYALEVGLVATPSCPSFLLLEGGGMAG